MTGEKSLPEALKNTEPTVPNPPKKNRSMNAVGVFRQESFLVDFAGFQVFMDGGFLLGVPPEATTAGGFIFFSVHTPQALQHFNNPFESGLEKSEAPSNLIEGQPR